MKPRTADTYSTGIRLYHGTTERLGELRDKMQAQNPDKHVRLCDVVALAIEAARPLVFGEAGQEKPSE